MNKTMVKYKRTLRGVQINHTKIKDPLTLHTPLTNRILQNSHTNPKKNSPEKTLFQIHLKMNNLNNKLNPSQTIHLQEY